MTIFTVPDLLNSSLEELLTDVGEQLATISYNDILVPSATQNDDIIIALAPLTLEEQIEGFLIVGLDGDDELTGSFGSDLIFGGNGNDIINTEAPFAEVLPEIEPLEFVEEPTPFFTIDAAYGGKGSDVMIGGNSVDLLFGGDGADEIFGEGGSDLLSGARGADLIRGGEGDDAIFGGISSDRLFGDEGDDFVFGDGGHDTVNGNDGDDFLSGGRGNDRLSGGIGDDDLFGGQGNNIMRGGQGNDFMDGGFGADDFAFRGDFGQDTIDNFDVGLDLLEFATFVTVDQVGSDAVVTAVGTTNTVTFLDIDALELESAYGLGVAIVA